MVPILVPISPALGITRRHNTDSRLSEITVKTGLSDTGRYSTQHTSATEDVGRNSTGQFVDDDDPRGVRSFAARLGDAIRRTAVEDGFIQQRNSSAALGNVSGSSKFTACLFRAECRRFRIVGITSYARKQLYSREGANIELIRNGHAVDQDDGPYGAEGYVRQAIAELPQLDGNYIVLGSWFSAGAPCGLSVREDSSPTTKNTSRFLPHAIVE